MTIGIGLDSFSYHRFFGDFGRRDEPTDTRWTTADFLNRAAELKVEAVSLQTAFLPEQTPDRIRTLGRQIDDLGLDAVLAWGHPSGLEGGKNPGKEKALHDTVKAAGEIGCRLVRFVGGDLFYHKIPAPERIERLLPIIKKAAEAAGEVGIALAIENHGDFGMKDLVTLVEGVGAENLGICFDGMNAVRVGDDLFEAAALAAPHMRMVHIRDFLPLSSRPTEVESYWPAAPLGRGRLEIEGLIHFLEKKGYEGNLFVEMAYMHPDFADEDAAVVESVAYLRKRIGS